MNDLSKLFSVTTVLGFVGLGLLGIGVAQKQDPEDRDVMQPIGIMETASLKDPVNVTNKGSGVFITPTKFLTASHVTEAITKETTTHIRMQDGGLYNVVDVKKDGDTDVSVVIVDRPYRGWTPSISCAPQKRGTLLTTIGNPLSMEFLEVEIRATGGRPTLQVSQNKDGLDAKPEATPFEGKKGLKRGKRFSRIPPSLIGPPPGKKEEAKGPNQFQISGMEFFQGPALPGQSGSPVFDKNGKIVGIITVSVVEQNMGSFTGLGMYVPTKGDVCEFLEREIKPLQQAKNSP